ncbi:phage major capsid protein [Liquorilactobacillus uvarum]|uniref:phage major capsid protein n=1 Tax=Liquorilactobacillus uvarum TaxID=303240 RepID=UPI00288B337E|nr:phage major capsid protein [Liquorilactobacillus uvarum]
MTTDKNKDVRTINGKLKIVRDATNPDSHVVSGYAVVFNQPSEDLGGFIEYVDPHAFDGVDMSNVLLLFNHDFNNTLARVTANNLTLTIDDNGLAFQATLPDTQLGQDTFTNIANGNYQGCSFGFTIADDDWTEDANGNVVHTINQVDKLYEISITPLPAYTETSVNIERSLEKLVGKKQERRDASTDDAQAQPVTVDPQTLQDLVSQIQALTQQVNDMQEDENDNGDSDGDNSGDAETEQGTQAPADGTNKPQPADQARDDDEEPLEQDGLDKHLEGEKRNLKDVTPKVNDKKEKEVRGFIGFLKSKGQTRDNVTTASDGSGAVIPTQILDVQKVPNDPANLAQYINRQEVSAPSGDLPILQKNNARMATKAELAQNPDLAFQGFKQVDYKIQTYAGVIPVSYEALSDMKQVTIQDLVSQGVSDSRDLTENDKIGAILQKATAVTATSVDDLKDAYNKGLSYYNRMIVCSETAYADIDKLKDGNGRYLFQDSITSASGKQLFGAPVVVVPDTVLGKDRDAKLFIGDLKAFVLETYKDEVAVNWVDNDIWGTKLAAYLRADFNVADDQAGKFVTFTPASTQAKGTYGK